VAEENGARQDEERKRLIEAARVVLSRSGWSGLKVSSVLRQSRCGTRTFYRHFDSKESLLFEVYGEELELRLRSDLPDADDPLSGVIAFVNTIIFGVYASPGALDAHRYLALHWREFLAERPADASRLSRPLVSALEQLISRGLATGVFPVARPHEDARVVLQLVIGQVAEAALRSPPPPPERVRELVLPFVVAALTAPTRLP
jgi:AcrR family transcriptional regulator